MKSRKLSFDWMIFASAGVMYLFGKYIAPRYEKMLKESGEVGEITPISTYCLIVSALLIVALIGRWIYRWKNRKSK
jgi:hypothetical protein